jgi:uncharacterized protein YbjT (DUF2867 family)
MTGMVGTAHETGRILITGATGNVGREVVAALARDHADAAPRIAIAAHAPAEAERRFSGAYPVVPFDFDRPETFAPAFTGVSRLFLMRPPHISDARRIAPAVEAARAAGVVQIVFLSLLGAEKNRVVPHAAIERVIEASGIPYVFLRASFFMQNLSTTHRAEIIDGEIRVPAGNGTTSFIDVRDIGAVAAQVLTSPVGPGRALDLTGSEALTYAQVAQMLSTTLNRPVVYTRPGALSFIVRQLRQGAALPFVLVMAGIYTTCRLGLAGRTTDDVARVLGRPPITMREFLRDNAEAWPAR